MSSTRATRRIVRLALMLPPVDTALITYLYAVHFAQAPTRWFAITKGEAYDAKIWGLLTDIADDSDGIIDRVERRSGSDCMTVEGTVEDYDALKALLCSEVLGLD